MVPDLFLNHARALSGRILAGMGQHHATKHASYYTIQAIVEQCSLYAPVLFSLATSIDVAKIARI